MKEFDKWRRLKSLLGCGRVVVYELLLGFHSFLFKRSKVKRHNSLGRHVTVTTTVTICPVAKHQPSCRYYDTCGANDARLADA